MMTPNMVVKLKRSLVLHEGLKRFPYIDTVGKVTIGIGYNLSDRGLPDSWIYEQYEQDVSYFYNQLSEFPWFNNLNEDRQVVLIDMCFMGWKKFLEFDKMIEAIANQDFKQAAVEMLDSKWAIETKNRATTLAHAMVTGVYEI